MKVVHYQTFKREADCSDKYTRLLEEAKAALEQAFHHLDEGGNATKHDLSWIRPLTMYVTHPMSVETYNSSIADNALTKAKSLT